MIKVPQERFVPKELAEAYLLKRAREDFDWFVRVMTGEQKKLMSIHKEWFDVINDKKTQLINISTFPGCGKTTLMQLWIAWRIGQEPYLTFLIVCASETKATERLDEVRRYIENDATYKLIFPHVAIDKKRKSNATRFNVYSTKWRVDSKNQSPLNYSAWQSRLSQFGEGKDATVLACGLASQSILGARITGAIFSDDIHNEVNSTTEELRAKIYRIFQHNIKSRLTASKISPLPKMVNMSNRFHPNDLSGRLSELVRANGDPIWYNITTPIVDSNGDSTYPELFGAKEVQKIKEEAGGEDSYAWQMLYMVNPSAASNGEFNLDDLRRPIPNPMPELQQVVISVDFAHTSSALSDYTVYTAIGKDQSSPFQVYILDCLRFKSERVADKIDRLVEFYNDIQSVYGNVKQIVFEDADSQHERQYLGDLRPEIKTTSVKLRHKSKADRLDSFAGYVQSGKVYFNTSMPLYNTMVGELLDFPSGKHDDICDTLSLVWELPDWVNMFGQSGIVYIRERIGVRL